jgi:hypothetical protein
MSRKAITVFFYMIYIVCYSCKYRTEKLAIQMYISLSQFNTVNENMKQTSE